MASGIQFSTGSVRTESPVAQRVRTTRPASDSAPDEREVDLLLEAARVVLRRHGVYRMTVRDVLAEAHLGTRAFYRHFSSKDELVISVFTEGATREAERLTQKIAKTSNPIDGVIAWIDGRLDLAFDRNMAAGHQDLSMEALYRRAETPAELEIAFNVLLAPLVEQLEEGRSRGLLPDVMPAWDARAIHDVTWGVVERQWSGFPLRQAEAREHVIRFCLQAIGAPGVDRRPEPLAL
jgi:AcrR family transcriptional regulator